MTRIINDSRTCARAHVQAAVLKVFLGTDGPEYARQAARLSKREGVVICYNNRVRIKRVLGCGWYQISGYREDGNDLALALHTLRASDRLVQLRKALGRVQITLNCLRSM